MKILLTGSGGNLGESLLRLGTQHQIQGVSRSDWSDLAEKLRDVNVVIHAASDLLTPVAREPYAVMDANLMTTARLLEALPKGTKARFVFISSCAVYGQSQI